MISVNYLCLQSLIIARKCLARLYSIYMYVHVCIYIHIYLYVIYIQYIQYTYVYMYIHTYITKCKILYAYIYIYIYIYPGRIYQLRYCDIASNQTQKIAKKISNANEISSSSTIINTIARPLIP